MATCNFTIENRCIVVTNSNLEFECHPELGDWMGDKSRELSQYADKFNWFNIVLTYGYYDDASIDFVERNEVHDLDWHYWHINITSKEQLFSFVSEDFNIPEETLSSVCADKSLDECYEVIDNIIREREVSECNAILDKIKADYDYEELRRIGVMSNGGGIYETVTDTAISKSLVA